MAPTRRARPQLGESWDNVEDDFAEHDNDLVEEEEEEPDRSLRRREIGSNDNDYFSHQNGARKRSTRSSVAPEELVMPRINDSRRSKTPRFRMNERSTTSDAGDLDAGRKIRTKTPRFRMNDRSMTSDAGKFVRKHSVLEGVVYEEDEDEMVDASSNYPLIVWERVLRPVISYGTDVVGHVLNSFKPLIAYALIAYLVVAALIFGSGFLFNSISTALTPICRIPGITTVFNPPFCAPPAPEIEGPVEFDKVVQAQEAFSEILDKSSAGFDLPLAMKRSEAGVQDLNTAVQYSKLPSKNELMYEFDGFIKTARLASRGLGKFNVHIGSTVDRILSTNRWTLRILHDIADPNPNQGSISRFFSENLNIFAPFQPLSLSKDLLLDQYLKHSSQIEETILELIAEAHGLLEVLENLEARLDVIAKIAMGDDVKVQENKDELLAAIWTKAGGNKSTVKRLNAQIELLKNVGQYRRIAWAQVSTTLVKLQYISHSLEDLRSRVSAPELAGTDRVPLEVHIDAISRGLQRLEELRNPHRKVQEAQLDRIADTDGRVSEMMIGGREP